MIPENIVKLLRSDIIEIAQLGVDWIVKNGNIVDVSNMYLYINKKFIMLEDKKEIIIRETPVQGNHFVYNKKILNPLLDEKYYNSKNNTVEIYNGKEWIILQSVTHCLK